VLVKSYESWDGWKEKVIVDMAGCGEIVLCKFVRVRKSAGDVRGGGLCQYFDPILQGGEKGRTGLIDAEFGSCTH